MGIHSTQEKTPRDLGDKVCLIKNMITKEMKNKIYSLLVDFKYYPPSHYQRLTYNRGTSSPVLQTPCDFLKNKIKNSLYQGF